MIAKELTVEYNNFWVSFFLIKKAKKASEFYTHKFDLEACLVYLNFIFYQKSPLWIFLLIISMLKPESIAFLDQTWKK